MRHIKDVSTFPIVAHFHIFSVPLCHFRQRIYLKRKSTVNLREYKACLPTPVFSLQLAWNELFNVMSFRERGYTIIIKRTPFKTKKMHYKLRGRKGLCKRLCGCNFTIHVLKITTAAWIMKIILKPGTPL